MKNLEGKNNVIILASITVVLILAVLFVLMNKTATNSGNSIFNVFKTEKNGPSNPDLIKQYKKKVKIVLKPYFDQEDFSNLLDQLMELTVPAEYKDLHLGLVIAFDAIKQGQERSEQVLIEQGISQIDELTTKYSFIK